jgi:hypothetical protein
MSFVKICQKILVPLDQDKNAMGSQKTDTGGLKNPLQGGNSISFYSWRFLAHERAYRPTHDKGLATPEFSIVISEDIIFQNVVIHDRLGLIRCNQAQVGIIVAPIRSRSVPLLGAYWSEEAITQSSEHRLQKWNTQENKGGMNLFSTAPMRRGKLTVPGKHSLECLQKGLVTS